VSEAATPAETPDERAERRFKRSLALLVGIAAVLAAVFALTAAEVDRRASNASATVTLNGVDTFVDLAGGGARDQFVRDAKRRALLLVKEGIVRLTSAQELAGTPAYGAAADAAQVDTDTASRLLHTKTALNHLALPASGVDTPMAAALEASDPAAVDPIIAESKAASAEATTWGNRGSRIPLALALLAFAGSLLALAALIGPDRGGRIARNTGAIAMALAALWAAAGFV
jgi:hypothetical protein